MDAVHVSHTNIHTKQGRGHDGNDSLLACTFNSIGTEMELPFGGYGLLGVCNVMAPLIDCAIRGRLNMMYPLLSMGRGLLRCTSAYVVRKWEIISSEYEDMRQEAEDMC
jgi:hypothetical protein